jgi:signal transduction histidine kinase
VRKISVQETDDAEKSLQSGKEPWLWAGLELKGDHLAADESGDEYFIHSLAIDKCPGAIVVQLTDLMTLHKTIINPLIKRARIIILVFCALIGLSVFFLYRKAQSEINRRKNAEENLITAKEAAETANEAKSDFLANMSHELRTPLNHIIGFTEVVVDKNLGDLNAVQEEYLSDALRSGKHLLSLINEILDLSKVEAGKLELELSEVCIKKLLRDSLKMVKEKTLKHRISLSTSIDGIPDIIRLDERKMKQILYNLLSNAVKFGLKAKEKIRGVRFGLSYRYPNKNVITLIQEAPCRN